jgi:hypothetical protein
MFPYIHVLHPNLVHPSSSFYGSQLFLFQTFLLVCNSYIEGFIVMFPYIHVLHPNLVHPFHYSPSYPISPLEVTSTDFSVPHSYLYRK